MSEVFGNVREGRPVVPDPRPAQNPPGPHAPEPAPRDPADPSLAQNLDFHDLLPLLRAARHMKATVRDYHYSVTWIPIAEALQDWRAALTGQPGFAEYFLHEIEKLL